MLCSHISAESSHLGTSVSHLWNPAAEPLPRVLASHKHVSLMDSLHNQLNSIGTFCTQSQVLTHLTIQCGHAYDCYSLPAAVETTSVLLGVEYRSNQSSNNYHQYATLTRPSKAETAVCVSSIFVCWITGEAITGWWLTICFYWVW